jgi:glycosyltransferase involved in cell wall biosynthesis
MKDRAEKSAASDRIRFAGAIPKSDIGAVMREHDLMLMTSSFEGYSRAIVEGLASGLPVITTPGGEPNGLVQTGVNGAHVGGYTADLFRAAVEIASKLSAADARASVAGLSAALIVPDVLNIPGRS